MVLAFVATDCSLTLCVIVSLPPATQSEAAQVVLWTLQPALSTKTAHSEAEDTAADRTHSEMKFIHDLLAAGAPLPLVGRVRAAFHRLLETVAAHAVAPAMLRGSVANPAHDRNVVHTPGDVVLPKQVSVEQRLVQQLALRLVCV